MKNDLSPHITGEVRSCRLDRERVEPTRNIFNSVPLADQDAPPAAVLVHLADALTVSDGGFSISPDGWCDARAGYAVSVFPECEERIDGPVGESRVARYLMSHASLLARGGVVLGGWRRPEDGVAYLDLSVVVPTRAQAIALAKRHGQRAVWDFAACRSISLMDKGGVASSGVPADERFVDGEPEPFRWEV